MSIYQCQACLDYQEELLDLNNGCGPQVVCFCFTSQELLAQYLLKQNLVDIPDDEELESAMMELGGDDVEMEDSVDEDLVGALPDVNVGILADPVNDLMDGFDREILEDYNSQLYQFTHGEDLEDLEIDLFKWLC